MHARVRTSLSDCSPPSSVTFLDFSTPFVKACRFNRVWFCLLLCLLDITCSYIWLIAAESGAAVNRTLEIAGAVHGFPRRDQDGEDQKSIHSQIVQVFGNHSPTCSKRRSGTQVLETSLSLLHTLYHLPSFATRTRTWNLRSCVQLLGKHQSRPSPPRARPQRWVNYSSRFNGADNLFFPFPRPRMKKHFWKWDHGRERHKLHMRLTAKERNMGGNRWRHEGIINTKCGFLQEKRLRGINCLAKEDLWRLSQIKWIVWREWTVHRKYAMVREMIFCFISTSCWVMTVKP